MLKLGRAELAVLKVCSTRQFDRFTLYLNLITSTFHIVTIVGESSRRMWDLEPARRLLGYTPRYRLDDLGVEFIDPFEH